VEHCIALEQNTLITRCDHCGSECPSGILPNDGLNFCCQGCSTVYSILKDNGLTKYYELEQHPGFQLLEQHKVDYSYLDAPEVKATLYTFEDDQQARIVFDLPAIHCSSCIWLLENLGKLHPGVLQVRVRFLEKKASISFDKELISLKELAELLNNIGYAPNISLKSKDQSKPEKSNKLILQIAVAGFCFGNAMIFSFPEYFGIRALSDGAFQSLFRYLNLFLAIPALLYAGKDYLVSAFKSLQKKVLHINVPLAIGIIALFLRSSFEVLSGIGAGYFDSLTGLIFFLLVGKWFQERTYDHISFDRDYKSYFPMAVTTIKDGIEHFTMLSDLDLGDRILIKNRELIPADGILFRGEAAIDYSFVTGESVPVNKELGEILYAGGRQLGEPIELELTKKVEQSRLTQLWNEYGIQHEVTGLKTFTDKVSKYFTIGLLFIAFTTLFVWLFIDVSLAFFAFTSVLIVACPCALALSTPFATSNMMRLFGKNHLYVQNASVVESLSTVDHIVFDKTGTLTEKESFDVKYRGEELSSNIKDRISSLASFSNHPLAKFLVKHLDIDNKSTVIDFKEYVGKGIQGNVEGDFIRIGSHEFIRGNKVQFQTTHVAVEINGQFIGYFFFRNKYKKDLSSLFNGLKKLGMKLALLSGDGEGERNRIQNKYKQLEKLVFQKDPAEKLECIRSFQNEGDSVMMVGDGLNDAGALAKSQLGLVVAEDVNNFTPAANAIIEAKSLNLLPSFIRSARKTMKVIHWSFALSICYNLTGLFFAVQGMLSPVIAAILMPLSSISIVLFNTFMTNQIAKREKLI